MTVTVVAMPAMEDLDDDNDGVPDAASGDKKADNCPRGDTDWTSNASTDNDGDGCRDAGMEDLDDDNDGVNDAADAFPRDKCASVDTDKDGDPDRLVPADCETDLTADLDDDNDLILDVADVDDNNNSLIEIDTLDDLARLRDDLNGDGADDGNYAVTTVGNTGCPNNGCNGYELTRSLNFSDAGSYNTSNVNRDAWTNGNGWNPIGSCSSSVSCTPYTAVFDGRDHTIADLFISVDNNVNGVGLFAAFRGRLQNLHLLDVSVNGGVNNVGALVGYGTNARYENLSVTGGSVMSPLSFQVVGGLVGNAASSNMSDVHVFGVDVAGSVTERVTGLVGGLVGSGRSAIIRYASVSGGSVTGKDTLGGLVGNGQDADIRYAYVSGVDVTGKNSLGGLVGDGQNVDIRYAYTSGVNVTGQLDKIGGLVGNGQRSEIRHAYVSGGSVSGRGAVGGLIGDGIDVQLYYSYVSVGPVLGSSFIGGLLGQTDDGSAITKDITMVSASYWDNQTTGQSTSAGGLGTGLPTAQLQSPIDFTGADNIYTLWSNFWCNPATGDEMESADELDAPFIRVWDLGTSSQYPALNCMPGGLAAQGRDKQ